MLCNGTASIGNPSCDAIFLNPQKVPGKPACMDVSRNTLRKSIMGY